MSDLIERQAVLDWLNDEWDGMVVSVFDGIRALPSAQSEIIRCKDCKHWNLQVGNVKGDGLGSCDFHNVNLVTGEGFCYWADRRGDSDAID